MIRSIGLLVVGWFTLLSVTPCQAEVPALVAGKGRTILFLGDSNTYAGLYIAYVDGYLRTRYPAEAWNLINLGLPSETLSGLSEPDHPYPRPDVHERVDRALSKIKPNVVFLCYGMNDGIYHPFSDDRLAKYKAGTEKLVAKIEKAGAKAILMTPSPFDPIPVAKNLLKKDAPKFSWMKPYEKYDAEVLRRYSDYLLEWRKQGYVVIDAHAAVHRFLKVKRETEPKYIVSGDGIHPNPTGHAAIAFEILRELKAPAEANRLEIDAAAKKVVKGDARFQDAKEGSVTLTWKVSRPMPTDPRWDKDLAAITKYQERFNKTIVQASGLPAGNYELIADGKVLATGSNTLFAKGVHVTDFPRYPDSFGAAFREKQKLLGPAWLSEIGFKRPGTPKGLALTVAQERAATIDRELAKLSDDRVVEIRQARR